MAVTHNGEDWSIDDPAALVTYRYFVYCGGDRDNPNVMTNALWSSVRSTIRRSWVRIHAPIMGWEGGALKRCCQVEAATGVAAAWKACDGTVAAGFGKLGSSGKQMQQQEGAAASELAAGTTRMSDHNSAMSQTNSQLEATSNSCVATQVASPTILSDRPPLRSLHWLLMSGVM